MRIMVFDVPAESGGALSVLYDFYNECKDDEENEYIFVVSLPELEETTNINILRFSWIKRSWGHRLYFDYFIAPKLIRKYKVNRVLSLQNILIPHSEVYQSVFVHNALPFSDYRFSFKEDKLLWVYQNIIGKSIMNSIKRADHVIVQTNWMKQKIIEYLNLNASIIEIKRPKFNIEVKEKFQMTKKSLSTFFYPASGVVFKNHKVIVNACLKLKEESINSYQVIFTLNGDENQNILELYNSAKENQLPIKFIGNIQREEVLHLYSKSILIFPSYIETVGLPLIEAKYHGTPIISSNSEYALEVLKDYNKAVYFQSFNHRELSELIKEKIKLSKDVL